MEFMRIRSPRSAPPVFFLEGSTEIMAIFESGLERKNLRTNSSVSEDFPAPPVPVIPMIGILEYLFWEVPSPLERGFRGEETLLLISSTKSFFSSEKFSTAEITSAIDLELLKSILSKSETWMSFPVA